MNQFLNRRWGIALIAVSGLAASLALSGCTPPMPPDVLAAQVENQIECQSGSQEVAVPADFMGSLDMVNVTLGGVCPEQLITEVPAGTSAGVEILDHAPSADQAATFAEMCTGEVITVPIFSYGVALSYNIIGLDGLILSPEVVAGILTGSITTWDDSAIQDLNQDYDLTMLPEIAVMSVDGPTGSVEAMTTWLSQEAPQAWTTGPSGTLEYGEKFADETELLNEVIAYEGTVAILPIVVAINNLIPMAAVDIQGEFINPDDTQLQKVGSGAMEVVADPTSLIATPATGGVPVEGNFDIAASKIVLAEGQPLIGWPIMGTAHAMVCNDPANPLPLSTVQFLVRLSGQGSFETYGLTPLPEPIRLQTFTPLQVTLKESNAE
jgi:ABC-type phosphate transport system substrate-binding protein